MLVAAVVALFAAASISVLLRDLEPDYPTWRVIVQVPLAVLAVLALLRGAVRLWRGSAWAGWALGGLVLSVGWALVTFLGA